MTQREPTKSKQLNSPQKFHCPTCKRLIVVPSDDTSTSPKSFPFCSERCKLIDLGAWLDAEYRIPAVPDDALDEPPTEDQGDS